MSFTTQDNTVIWALSAGPVFLQIHQAEQLLSIFSEATDAALREGDREASRVSRKLWLELDEALQGSSRCSATASLPAATPTALPPMPELRPLTCVVRQLNPELWRNAG